MKKHRWSGWPGAFCLDCHAGDNMELCVAEHNWFFDQMARGIKDIGECPDHPFVECTSNKMSNEQPYDAVNHPPHYGGEDSTYEVIKIIEAYDLNFCLGNTIKYILRADKKGNFLQDLKKAAWYLNRQIERMEKNK